MVQNGRRSHSFYGYCQELVLKIKWKWFQRNTLSGLDAAWAYGLTDI